MKSRKNEGKPKLSLIPLALAEACARGLEHGTEKYSRQGWRTAKGYTQYEILDSILRHGMKLADPDEPDIDKDSGLHHADLMAAGVGFLTHAVKHDWPKEVVTRDEEKAYLVMQLSLSKKNPYNHDI